MEIRRSLVTAAGLLVTALLATSGSSGIPAEARGLPGSQAQQVSAAASAPGMKVRPGGLPG